jgi:hypothetical protein
MCVIWKKIPPSIATSHKIWNTQLVLNDATWVQSLTKLIAIFMVMNIGFIIKLSSLSAHIDPPPILIIEPRMVEHISFCCLFSNPHLTTYQWNIGIHVIVVVELGMSSSI